MIHITASELFHTVQRIKVISKQLAEDVLAGAYRSAFKGQGMEFEEVREYQIGDEVRSIDWNVTARMNHPFVKIFREERDLTVYLMVDLSASTQFGSKNKFKNALIAEVSALLAFSAIKNNDRIGLVLFSDIVEKFVPPNKGVRHILHIIRELLAFQPKHRGTDIKELCTFLGRLQKKAICFLISDFLFSTENSPLNLISKKHDLIAISVNDPMETSLPKTGLLQLTDLENGHSLLLDTNATTLQKNYSKRRFEQNMALKHYFNKINAGFIQLSTNQPYVPPLRKFFRMRELQRR